MYTILENGNIMDITLEQRDMLLTNNIIYHCPDCSENVYHLDEKCSFEEVLNSLTS